MAVVVVGALAIDEDVAHLVVVDGDIQECLDVCEDCGELDVGGAHDEGLGAGGVNNIAVSVDPAGELEVLVGSSGDGDAFTFEEVAAAGDGTTHVSVAVNILDMQGEGVVRTNLEVGGDGGVHASECVVNVEVDVVEGGVNTHAGDGPVDEAVAVVCESGSCDSGANLVGLDTSRIGGTHGLIVDSEGDGEGIVSEVGYEALVAIDNDGAEILLYSSKRLDEPVAWAGPIVMNTREELNQAFEDLANGTFIKKQAEY